MPRIKFQSSNMNLRLHELRAITILLEYFGKDIVCLTTNQGKTPDIEIQGKTWEIKSPIGNGPKTLENIIRKANHQSENIIIDLSRIKMNQNQALSRIKFFLKTKNHHIHKLLVITKTGKILELINK